MKKIIGYILIAVGAIHGISVIVGIATKGNSPAPLLGTALFIGIGGYLLWSAKKSNN
jgi:hypothetical protein